MDNAKLAEALLQGSLPHAEAASGYARRMPRPARPKPNQLAPDWPAVSSEDPIGEVARNFVSNLRDAIGDQSVRSVAKATGVSHTTIQQVLRGDAWPDLYTIAKLERGLGILLWPGLPSIARHDDLPA